MLLSEECKGVPGSIFGRLMENLPVPVERVELSLRITLLGPQEVKVRTLLNNQKKLIIFKFLKY